MRISILITVFMLTACYGTVTSNYDVEYAPDGQFSISCDEKRSGVAFTNQAPDMPDRILALPSLICWTPPPGPEWSFSASGDGIFPDDRRSSLEFSFACQTTDQSDLGAVTTPFRRQSSASAVCDYIIRNEALD
ncbi:MAG: hypothetical protein AAGH90_10830 [Pseudomonadota bacterium]